MTADERMEALLRTTSLNSRRLAELIASISKDGENIQALALKAEGRGAELNIPRTAGTSGQRLLLTLLPTHRLE